MYSRSMALRNASVRTQFRRKPAAQRSTCAWRSISTVETRSLSAAKVWIRQMPMPAVSAVINRMRPKPRPRRGPTRSVRNMFLKQARKGHATA